MHAVVEWCIHNFQPRSWQLHEFECSDKVLICIARLQNPTECLVVMIMVRAWGMGLVRVCVIPTDMIIVMAIRGQILVLVSLASGSPAKRLELGPKAIDRMVATATAGHPEQLSTFPPSPYYGPLLHQ